MPARSLFSELFPGSQDSATAMKIKDALAIALATLLPWSTSGVALFAGLFVLSLLPTLDWRALQSVLKRPASVTVLLFVALGVVGILWSTDAAWSDRLGGAGQLGKLLLIPLLMYHFERSPRGFWVMLGFTLSCCILCWCGHGLIGYFLRRSVFLPSRRAFQSRITSHRVRSLRSVLSRSRDWPINRSGWAEWHLESRSFCFRSLSSWICCLSVSARTALVYLPVLLVIFALRHHSLRTMSLVLVAAVAVGGLVWTTSPYLRMRVDHIGTEYELYKEQNAVTSTGERLEYWRKSLKFIAEAPIFGHGTGSIRQLFQQDGVGQSGVSAEVIANPHNQTLHSVIQWGLLEEALLSTQCGWAHLRLFLRGDLVSWIGLAAVIENFTSSLLNSHIADFNEGWLYVLAVGVAGGLVLKATEQPCALPMP